MVIKDVISNVKKGAMFTGKAIKETGKSLDEGVEKLGKRIDKSLNKKKKDKIIKVKRVIKDKRITVKIPEAKPAEYKPVYFKNEIEDAKNSMFFS